MPEKKLDVFGIGNAMVDILAFVSDETIAELGLEKGGMTLMDSAQQAKVLTLLEHQNLELASGGSAANTMVAIAQSGGNGLYCGKVAHDPHGEFYRQDMEKSGIQYPTPLAPEASHPTGTCVVLTTPDAERTMCTHLGISTSLDLPDLPLDRVADAKYLYVEGYLWDAPQPKQACRAAMQKAREQETKVAFTFSDPFVVERYRDEFKEMIPQYCDVLFCNADEAKSFCETDSLDRCAEMLAPLSGLTFITDGPNGCRVVSANGVEQVDGFPVNALDTVGAGDAFAGGVLYGLSHEMQPTEAARWGHYIASRVVQIVGPRLSESLQENLKEVLSV